MPRKNKPITLNPTREFRDWFENFCEQKKLTEGEGLAALIETQVMTMGFDPKHKIMNKRGKYIRLGDNP